MVVWQARQKWALELALARMSPSAKARVVQGLHANIDAVSSTHRPIAVALLSVAKGTSYRVLPAAESVLRKSNPFGSEKVLRQADNIMLQSDLPAALVRKTGDGEGDGGTMMNCGGGGGAVKGKNCIGE